MIAPSVCRLRASVVSSWITRKSRTDRIIGLSGRLLKAKRPRIVPAVRQAECPAGIGPTRRVRATGEQSRSERSGPGGQRLRELLHDVCVLAAAAREHVEGVI